MADKLVQQGSCLAGLILLQTANLTSQFLFEPNPCVILIIFRSKTFNGTSLSSIPWLNLLCIQKLKTNHIPFSFYLVFSATW